MTDGHQQSVAHGSTNGVVKFGKYREHIQHHHSINQSDDSQSVTDNLGECGAHLAHDIEVKS